MSSHEALVCITSVADADFSTKQFCIAKVGATGKCSIAADGAAPYLGVIQTKPDADGKAVTIAISGVAKIKMSAASGSAGAKIKATTGGVGVATTTQNDHIIGVALEDWAASGLARVLMFGPGAHVAA